MMPCRGPLHRPAPAARPTAIRRLHLGRAAGRGHRLRRRRAHAGLRGPRAAQGQDQRLALVPRRMGRRHLPPERLGRRALHARRPADGGRGPRDRARRRLLACTRHGPGTPRAMAELRNLDEKLAEVLGLAQAAKGATDKIEKLVDEKAARQVLEQMRQEAEETARRCEAALDDDAFDGRKTAIAEQARETKQEATEMMDTYLGDDADGLDGFEFLIMAEAGELGHWEILKTLNDQAGIGVGRELTEFAIPVQQRHERVTRETALALAGAEDALEES